MNIPAITDLANRIKRVVLERVPLREESEWQAIACEAVTVATTLAVCPHPYFAVRYMDDGWARCRACSAAIVFSCERAVRGRR